MAERNFSSAVILGLTDSGERIPASAGRISTRAGSACEIFQAAVDEEKNASLIHKVTQSGHNSTIEHTVYNLAFENVSVFAEQFLIEFRLASFTVKSRRYVDFTNSGYYAPDTLPAGLRDRYARHMDKLFAAYAALTENGVPKEDARFVLPYCLYSNFYCSVNAREFLHMLSQMLYGRGAGFPELKKLGESLLEQAKKLTPGILQDFEHRAEKISAPQFPAFQPDEAPRAPEKSAISLLGATPEAARVVSEAALCVDGGYAPEAARRIAEIPEHRAAVIKYLLDSPRPRALEHVNYTFAVRGISLACLTHFTRHRMQSIQIPCLTAARRDAYVCPETIIRSATATDLYKRCFTESQALYQAFRDAGVAETDLVYLLLSGNLIDVVTTMNARELLLFFKLRCCNRAQWEIREHADAMLALCRAAEPEIFRHFGPSCFVSRCPEGRMSCGRQEEVRERYLAL